MTIGHPMYSVVLSLLSALALAQDPAPSAAENGTILGIVAERSTGRAIDGVEVWLEPAERPSPIEVPEEEFPHVTLSDTDGRFLLERIPPGEYRLIAAGDSLLQQEYGQRGLDTRGTPITVRAGERLNLDFRMLPTGTISGWVLDEAGEPVPGIAVYAQGFQFMGGKRVRRDLGQMRFVSSRRVRSISFEKGYGVTDAEGVYRLSGLPPGDYSVVVRHQAGGQAREGFNDIVRRAPVAPVYYPGTPRADDAATVRIVGGEVPGVDIVWRQVAPVTIRGQVVGHDGAGQVSLAVTTPEGLSVAPLSVAEPLDPDGSFELLVAPFRSYVLNATVQTRGGGAQMGTFPLDVNDSDVEGVSVILQGPTSISGQIVAPPGTPEPESPSMVQFQWGGSGYSGFRINFSRANPDGTFQLRGIERRDDYRISLEGLPDGHYIESATFGAADPLTGGLDLSGILPADALLTIRLGSGAGEVAGRVVDAMGMPRAGAKVTLVPNGVYGDRYDRYRSAFTDEEGRFRLEVVPPGQYQVFGWEAIPIDAEMNEDFLAPYRGRGRTILLDRTSTVEVELQIIEAFL